MKQFVIENRLFDVYYIVNDIKPKEKDPMFIRGSKCIDSVIASDCILEHIEGSVLRLSVQVKRGWKK